ncbi:uncharacterized protein PAC_19746 [Phialocephala subalpina]|uniref:Uncharacterized protein n=1 Tax=Phialocephala subalpina TaxID=576137 RepID=A0A1L7XXZ4_9HELO|nr:uncharacterized protein PAC_19746 [Phialocephala subalpina]
MVAPLLNLSPPFHYPPRFAIIVVSHEELLYNRALQLGVGVHANVCFGSGATLSLDLFLLYMNQDPSMLGRVRANTPATAESPMTAGDVFEEGDVEGELDELDEDEDIVDANVVVDVVLDSLYAPVTVPPIDSDIVVVSVGKVTRGIDDKVVIPDGIAVALYKPMN